MRSTTAIIVRVLGMRAPGRILSKKLFPLPEQKELKNTFIARWSENDGQAYLSALTAVADWNISDRLGSINCPTLVISAAHDFIPLVLKQEYVGKLLKAVLRVIPGSMHFTPVDYPDRFNRVLMEFLEEQKHLCQSRDHGLLRT